MKQLKSNKYKLLMSDVDGTLIKYDYNALPTKKVCDAIEKAQGKIAFCLITGRSYGSIKNILKKLNIKSGYAVINNGANVIDLSTLEMLYDKSIPENTLGKIVDIFNEENIPFYVKETFEEIGILKGIYKDGFPPKKAYMFYTEDNMEIKKVEEVLAKLSKISSISVHKSQHRFPNKFGLNITNNKATKLHGVAIVKELLNIKSEEIIGIGDGYNDFPLLMACGLKVAMGNGVPELKEIADYIAPTVTEDGLAHIIERFVLDGKSS